MPCIARRTLKSAPTINALELRIKPTDFSRKRSWRHPFDNFGQALSRGQRSEIEGSHSVVGRQCSAVSVDGVLITIGVDS